MQTFLPDTDMYWCTSLDGFAVPGKISMVIDGQFGSTGKGLISGAVGLANQIDYCVERVSPNSGHTFYLTGRMYKTRMLPVSAIVNEFSNIYLSPGSVIDVDILIRELEEFDIRGDRLIIHPRAAVVSSEDIDRELNSAELLRISSTRSGAGAARADKVMRSGVLAFQDDRLRPFVKERFDVDELLFKGKSFFVETGQGFDLSLNYGYSYPHCTSVDVIPSAVLADVGVHPSFLGKVLMSIRTYPIRVGNEISSGGSCVGFSGPAYPDSRELTWEELRQVPEKTTVTKKVRRVFTFSRQQYAKALKWIKPDLVFLNFMNYLRHEDVESFREAVSIRKPDIVGFGPEFQHLRDFCDAW